VRPGVGELPVAFNDIAERYHEEMIVFGSRERTRSSGNSVKC
jgi:hypothetical protein